MLSPLSQKDYLSAEVLALERERLFGRLWIFAALRQLLEKPDSFATRTIGGVPVVLQNCGGVIKAFENQCLHRQMPLQWEDYGRRPLVCRYHGWSYDADGAVRHIPGRDSLYRFPESEVAAMRLRQIAVACVGNLIFVNLAENPIPIGEQFSEPLLARLEAASNAFDGEVMHTRVSAKYNWKLSFENVMDGNHVRYLHTGTFLPHMPPQFHGPGEEDPGACIAQETESQRHELRDVSFEFKVRFKVTDQSWHRRIARFGQDDAYYNFFLYPNVNFISVAGRIFLIQQFDPVSPALTEIGLSLMTATKVKRIPASAALLWAHFCAEKEVLDEDIRALEELQSRLYENGRRASHGAYESHLMKNRAVYRRLMGMGSA